MGEANFYYFTCLKFKKVNFHKKANKMADQTERAFQKQKNVFLNNKAALIAGPKAKKIRYLKNVGLGFKTPIEAKEGNYIDKKCPFTGLVQIRGRILNGVVQKLKMQRTVVIKRLSSFHQKIQAVRKETQEHLCPFVAMLP